MNTGKETWKWALVVILLAVFLITANQAYQHLANQEDFAPPDDYLKGDSWDLEHNTGPGAGQPTSVSENNTLSPDKPSVKVNQRLSNVKPIVFDDKSDWNQVSDSKPVNSDSNNSQTNTNIPKKESEPEKKVEQPIKQVNEKQPEQTNAVEKPATVNQPVNVEPVESGETIESNKQVESSEKIEQPKKESEENLADANPTSENQSTNEQPSSDTESTLKE